MYMPQFHPGAYALFTIVHDQGTPEHPFYERSESTIDRAPR